MHISAQDLARRTLATLDANNTGALETQEFQLANSADGNNDQQLDAAELQSLFTRAPNLDAYTRAIGDTESAHRAARHLPVQQAQQRIALADRLESVALVSLGLMVVSVIPLAVFGIMALIPLFFLAALTTGLAVAQQVVRDGTALWVTREEGQALEQQREALVEMVRSAQRPAPPPSPLPEPRLLSGVRLIP